MPQGNGAPLRDGLSSFGSSQSALSRPVGFDPERELEFRPDEDGALDEIVARFHNGMVHVETMSDQGCYVGFYWDDGRYCQWWIGVKGRSKLTYRHEDGKNPPSRFTAWGVDRLPSDDDAIAMEAGTATTEGRGPQDDSAGL